MAFERGRALVVAVAGHAESGLDLPRAVANDARDVADALKSPDLCSYPDANVAVLVDGDATLAGIRGALADLAASAQTDDTVAVFFSGHGCRLGAGDAATSALVPSDCQLADLEGTTLGEAELTAALAAIKAERLLVVIDACHAGGAAALKAASGSVFAKGFGDKSLQRLAQGTGRVVLASCRADEVSEVLLGARNSVFTGAVLEALKGGVQGGADGTVRVFDLFNRVAETVRQAVPGGQHPVFKASDLEENFPVALALGGRKSTAGPAPAPTDARGLDRIMSDLYPAGPTDQDIWVRAMGDPSSLRLGGTGRAAWFSALRTLERGGGGRDISQRSLVEAALEEFPNHPELSRLLT